MKTLEQQIEDMRAHVKDLTATERALLRALDDELRRSDEDLLHAIRRVAADHEQRRSVIMGELQALAANAGLLPRPLTASDAAIANGIQRRDRPALNHNRQHAPRSLEEEVSYHLGRMH
jgi:hypothetical protein